jgi:hypothetical protein
MRTNQIDMHNAISTVADELCSWAHDVQYTKDTACNMALATYMPNWLRAIHNADATGHLRGT